ncbi:hypothetical protein LTR56_011864 [Elasticomyces elasticus]|nr:hypothetical protein LTR56_011864 [Elasticomyces elasticus]KAK3666407.1 hypothetical protein LTR22_002712 [Elasticomyces elasticus]KAK4931227.1 hypothetical protein LTR49_002285 [Elasticomyces elasticus]KAK5767842.1 hypothetical protein LTS12_001994 [Elasticomyces elasticus]
MRATSHWQLACFMCCAVALWLIWTRAFGHGFSDIHIKYTSLEVSTRQTNTGDTRVLRSRIYGHASVSSRAHSTAVVIGRLSTENTTWTTELGQGWQAYVYVVNDTTAPLHTARNKGREANAYLTYIIEHYHKLPDVAVFVHAHRNGYPQAWHTEGAGNDIVDSLRRLNTAHVLNEGYANLRCSHDPGCSPDRRIQPYRHVDDMQPLDRDASAEVAWLEAWPQLFPDTNSPVEIAAPCCAQFVVSREQIQQRPLTDYQRYHDWLMQTALSDDISGRVMEYAWHIIFGKEVIQ